MKPVVGIFLASGKSSRMNPIGDKNQLLFAGKPLCVYLLERAIAGGISSFVVVTNGENTADIQEILDTYSIKATVLSQNDLNEGMAGAIADALEYIKEDTPLCILGGNDAIEPEAIEETLQKGFAADGAILAKKVEHYFPGGYLTLNKDGSIEGVIEKPGAGAEPSDLVNIVCHMHTSSKALQQALSDAASANDDVYEVALDTLFRSKKYKAVTYTGVWQAIKYPWHILDMMNVLAPLKGFIDETADVHETAVIGPHVVLGAGVRVFPHACVSGTTSIGAGSIIGNGVLVRDSMIGENCQIGFQSEVARSYLAADVTTHMAYIGDSVVDNSVNFGAFSCTANLRLDRANIKVSVKKERINTQRQKCGAIVGNGSQIGIHAALMPGVILPKCTLVFPHCVYDGKLSTGK